MEKLNIRNKASFSFHKSKKTNLILKGIEEYQSYFDIIQKENETNEEIHKIELNLFNIYNKIISATNEYTKKIEQINENLKPNESSYEGRIQKIMYDILNNISNALKNIFNKISYIKDHEKNKSKGTDGLKKNKDELVQKLLEKIQEFKQQRNAYIEEMNNYEIYLVQKELGSIGIDDEKDIIKEKENNKGNNKETSIFDNHEKVYEQQSLYIKCKEDFKNFIKVLFNNLNTERKILYNSIHLNSSNFINFINTELTNLNEFFKEEINLMNKNNMDNKNIFIDGDNIVNQIIEEDFYTFKFVLMNKNDKNKEDNNKIEDNSKNKKKKKDKEKEKDKAKKNNDIDNLYEKLEDNNIFNMIKEAEKNKLSLSQKTKDKMELLTTKKYIESIIELIIKDPERYDEDTKTKYIKTLESNEEYQRALMQYLNNYRGNGKTDFDKSIILIFSDLFKLVLDRSVKNNKYKLVNLVMILSLTYYHLKENEVPESKTGDNNRENDTNKIYISEYLKKDQVFQDSSFWSNYLDELVKIELDKMKRIRDASLITEKHNMNAICSSIYTLIQNMIDYELDHEFIQLIFGNVVEKYNIDDNNKINLSSFLASKIINE